MSKRDSSEPLAIDDLDRIRRVRAAFNAAGFTAAEITRRLKTGDVDIARRDVPKLLRECPDDTFGAIARLLVLGLARSTDAIRTALGEPLAKDLLDLGLFGDHDDSSLVGTFRFAPFHDVLLLQEAPWSPALPGLSTQVMSVSGSTRTLAQLAITTPCESVLELGCGNGLIGILQAAHAKRVIATDLNPRALNMTAFSARLNGIENLETRLGSLFDPVAGMLFDRIVTNPPYVLTPPKNASESKHMYRDSGFPADGLSESVVRGLPRYLKPGGFAQSMINWACVKGEPWQERIQSWLKENDCDAWLLRFETLTPAQYATQWVPKMPENEFPRFLQTFDEWLAYYEREKIESIGAGLITIRRRGGTNWFSEDSIPEQIGPCGDAILRGFAARDFLTSIRSENDVLDTVFTLAPETRWAVSQQPAEQGWTQAGSRIKLSTGLAFSLDVDATGMKLVSRIRGTKPLGAHLVELAGELKQDVSRLAATALPLVQTLIEQGFLLPAGRP